VGIVTENNDPEGLGRVRVKCPTLTEEHESNWARVVATGAGSERGFDCLPEIDDEVLVAFEHGNIHRPYVLGGVWNGQDAPPEAIADSVADGNVRLRTIKTRTGHVLQFIEEDKGSSKAGVHLTTTGGHEIYLNDSEQLIEIKSNGGHVLKMADQNNTITMQSTGKIELTAPQKITLTVGSSSIELSMASIETSSTNTTVRSTAKTEVQGSMVKIVGSANISVAAPSVSLG
jgi:uncharacterized protein involved in type VI secretion and phage assembly